MESGTPSPVVQPQVQTAPETQSAPPQVADDPELDFGDFKLKKSEAGKHLKAQKEHAQAANARFQEAAAMRKESAAKIEIADLLTKDVRAALAKAGVRREDMVSVAEQILSDEIAEASMDPRDKELRDAKAEAKAAREERERSEQERSRAQYQTEVAQYEGYLANGFTAAIKSKGVPPDPYILSRMATALEAAIEAGENPSFDELAEYCLEEEDSTIGKRLHVWDDAQFERRAGGAVLERSRKFHLAKANGGAPPKPARDRAITTKSGSPRKRLTEQELKAKIKQRISP